MNNISILEYVACTALALYVIGVAYAMTLMIIAHRRRMRELDVKVASMMKCRALAAEEVARRWATVNHERQAAGECDKGAPAPTLPLIEAYAIYPRYKLEVYRAQVEYYARMLRDTRMVIEGMEDPSLSLPRPELPEPPTINRP